MKKGFTLYLHMHQPWRLTRLNYLDLGTKEDLFLGPDGGLNKDILLKVAKKSYLPTLKLFKKLSEKNPRFVFSISITGTLIEQLQLYAPKVIELLQELVAMGKVEILAETYYHSLAALYSLKEFGRQVEMQQKLVNDLFDVRSTSFRNTELIYNDYIAALANILGFRTVIAEGWDKFLKWRSANYVYEAKFENLNIIDKRTLGKFRHTEIVRSKLKLLLKNYKLSDDIAFRFSDRNWKEYPLTTEKYFDWVDKSPGEVVNLFMDFETFGEHQWKDTGVFNFIADLVTKACNEGYNFYKVAEAAAKLPVQDTLSVPELTSWADTERDLSAWRGNKMQNAALDGLYELEPKVHAAVKLLKNSKRIKQIWDNWGWLQTSDHFYYMSTKYWNDGDVHKYFSPYDSPYEAFINYMNVLEDFQKQLAKIS